MFLIVHTKLFICRFKSEMRGGVETILPSFENLLVCDLGLIFQLELYIFMIFIYLSFFHIILIPLFS